MLRSRAVAKVNPSSTCSTVIILGIGKSFLTNLLFTSQKLLRKHTVLFFFGIIYDGKAHSDVGCLPNTPSFYNLSTSLMSVSLCIVGTGKAYWDTWLPAMPLRCCSGIVLLRCTIPRASTPPHTHYYAWIVNGVQTLSRWMGMLSRQ